MNKIKLLSNQYRVLSTPQKAVLWYTFCNIVQKGISFLIVPIYTRVLTTTEYGDYSTFVTWRDILIIFATMNLYCGVFTKAMVDYQEDRDRYTSSIQTLSFLITLTISGIYLSASQFWNSVFDLNSITMCLLFVYFAVYPAFQFWTCRQCVEYRYVSMVTMTLIMSVAIPVVSLTLLFCTELREQAVILGYLITQIVIGSIFFVRNLYKGRSFYNKQYWVSAIRFNIPLIPHYLSMIVLSQADRLMIKSFCGSDMAGIYSLAAQISHLMGIVTTAIHSAFTPWIFGKLKEGNTSEIGKNSNKLCVMVAALTFIVILVAPEAVSIIGTSAYMKAIWVIPALASGMFFTFVYGFFSDIEFYFGATHYVMIASVSGGILNLILNAICIPRFGFIAAAYTTAFCYAVFMVVHFCFMQRVCTWNAVNKQPFDIKMMSLITVILVAGAAACMLLYRTVWLRYILILGIVAVAWHLRGNLIAAFKNKKN